MNEYIRFAYGEFSARIILHSKTEIKKLSFKLSKYISNSKISLNKIKNKDIYLLLKNKNAVIESAIIYVANEYKDWQKLILKYFQSFIVCNSMFSFI